MKMVPFTLTALFLLASFICIIFAATRPDKVPLWIGVILLWIVVALQIIPKG
jgi:hypothetical protein